MQAERECTICGTQFSPRRKVDKTCSLDCQIQLRRQLSRESTARHYKPRAPRPDTECESCKTRIPAPKTGPVRKWCEPCKAKLEHVRARKRLAVRRCYKCQTPVPDATRKPGKAVCDNCRVDPRKRAADHEQQRRLRKYGLTQGEYDQLLADQGGRCPTCGTDDPGAKGWCIDHCHSSDRVRALLCNQCNTALGLTRENPAILRALADFAERWQRVQSEIKI